jgi:pterin-4a-carbinolamine dehydratase
MIICRCYADVKAPSAPLRPTIQIRNEPLPVWNVVTTIGDDVQFERFRAGEDFSNRLADITDAYYSAHYHEMVMALFRHSWTDISYGLASMSDMVVTATSLTFESCRWLRACQGPQGVLV